MPLQSSSSSHQFPISEISFKLIIRITNTAAPSADSATNSSSICHSRTKAFKTISWEACLVPGCPEAPVWVEASPPSPSPSPRLNPKPLASTHFFKAISCLQGTRISSLRASITLGPTSPRPPPNPSLNRTRHLAWAQIRASSSFRTRAVLRRLLSMRRKDQKRRTTCSRNSAVLNEILLYSFARN